MPGARRSNTTGKRTHSKRKVRLASARSHDTRAVAAKVITEVLVEGRSLTAALKASSALALLDDRDRALATEFAYGVLRWRTRLEQIIGRLLSKPLRMRDADIEALLMVGLYQLEYTRVPTHAAVSETVAATVSLDKTWARALVNATLRRFDRERDSLLERIDRADTARLAHPAWLLDALRSAWPQTWADIASASNERAPMHLRVNRQHHDRTAYLQMLRAKGIEAYALTSANGEGLQPGGDGIALAHAVSVEALPGFSEGHASVQDGAAQLAADLIGLAPGLRVLDACAAPGGKTAHMLERETQLASLDALDESAERLESVRDNLTRIGVKFDGGKIGDEASVSKGQTEQGTPVSLIAADAGEPHAWWDGNLYDRILLDAPCTATGVIRRHPDIKHLRRQTDVAASASRQRALLEALWPLLAPGGCLLYATCSVLPDENEANIERFVKDHADAVGVWDAEQAGSPVKIGAGTSTDTAPRVGLALRYGRQLLPGRPIDEKTDESHRYESHSTKPHTDTSGTDGEHPSAPGSNPDSTPRSNTGVDGFYYALVAKI